MIMEFSFYLTTSFVLLLLLYVADLLRKSAKNSSNYKQQQKVKSTRLVIFSSQIFWSWSDKKKLAVITLQLLSIRCPSPKYENGF